MIANGDLFKFEWIWMSLNPPTTNLTQTWFKVYYEFHLWHTPTHKNIHQSGTFNASVQSKYRFFVWIFFILLM